MINSPKFAILFALIMIIGCTKKDQTEMSTIQPVLPMKAGEIREFTANGLFVIFKRANSDTFNLSLFLLGTDGEEDSSLAGIEELILRTSLIKEENDTTVLLVSSHGFTALTVKSKTAKFETSLEELLSVFYNQSFDSTIVDSVRMGRLNSLPEVNDEDLQRYHADKFVTSRLLCVIEGNFSHETVQYAIEKSFYGRTVGEYRRKVLKFPQNPFISKFRSREVNSDSTAQKRKNN